jgi:hypothetical protein
MGANWIMLVLFILLDIWMKMCYTFLINKGAYMNVTLDFEKHVCKVVAEKGDRKFYKSGWGNPESAFLYKVKNELIKQGYDVIKKLMCKDGHLVDDKQQYIRSRRRIKNEIMIYNSNYAIHDAGEEFNKNGEYELLIVL